MECVLSKIEYDLVIFDPHVEANQCLKRFKHLNNLICSGDYPIRNIVCVGDFLTLDSLSTHETPGSKADRTRPDLEAEFESAKDAQEILFRNVKIPKKNRHITKGNHEHRFDRWAQANPSIASAIRFNSSSGLSDHWGSVRKYGEWAHVRGIGYTHVPFDGMGKPISGIWRTRTAALCSPSSVIFGHSHNMQFSCVPLFGSNNGVRCALSGPAFQDAALPNYAKNTQSGWMYGVILVNPMGPNKGFTFNWLSMKELENFYG